MNKFLSEIRRRSDTTLGSKHRKVVKTRSVVAKPPRAIPPVDDAENILVRERHQVLADVGIVVALPEPELQQVKDAFGSNWREERREGALFHVTETAFGDRAATVVVSVQNYMGMVSAAILTGKTIRGWHPRLVVMCGICAGVRKFVNLGDVVVARQVFDYGSGKLIRGRLYPDYQHVSIDATICSSMMSFANERQVLHEIRTKWGRDTGRPKTDLQAKLGDFASGSAVVADSTVVEGIKQHKRSLLAIDMEAYGFARAAADAGPEAIRFLIVKGVQDYADSRKSDAVREYAGFVSAEFARRYLDRNWRHIYSPGG